MEAARQEAQHENKTRKTLFVNIASGDEAEDESENKSADVSSREGSPC